MKKVEAIRALIDAGRVNDVLDFVEGDSPFISDASFGVLQDLESRRLWILVVHHLRFISEFGNCSSDVDKGGKKISSFVSEFEEWLDKEAPEIAE
ncbi:hypothetical protein, partial [Pseudomonas protegens]|uniref:hypothetical protein n=2 Tax=Pseudomonas TaxID=286 RepID=UPI001B3241F5